VQKHITDPVQRVRRGEGTRVPSGDHALVLDGGGHALGEVALKLVRMGILVHYARWLDEGMLLVQQEAGGIRAVVVPPEIDPSDAGRVLDAARTLAPDVPIPLVVSGQRPPDATRAALRRAGASWALWEPFDDADLRFVLNSATALPSELAPRREPRAPVSLLSWVVVRTTRCFGVLCSLSAQGAFIEMPQPLPVETEVELEFSLHESTFRTAARVIYRNAREELRSPNLPIGVGLLFLGMKPANQERIREFVKQRAARFTA